MTMNWEAIQKASENLQSSMKEAHQALNSQTFTGEAGAGLVTVTMLGNYRVSGVDIADQAFNELDNPQDKARFIGDLCAAACNDAANKIEAYSKSKMQSMAMNFDLNAIKGPKDES
jgi:nucleoid-associated protein EbfC